MALIQGSLGKQSPYPPCGSGPVDFKKTVEAAARDRNWNGRRRKKEDDKVNSPQR